MFEHFSLPTVLISYVALLFSLSVHEASHAGAAYLLGDDTAARLGRMSLNPLAHIDWFGTVLFPLMGLIFGGFFIGWAKPVPFDPRYLTRRLRLKVSSALISLAGPASNLVMSVVFMVVTSLAVKAMGPGPESRVRLFQAAFAGPEALINLGLKPGAVLVLGLGGALISLNVVLAAFNLIPVGALDGAGVLGGILPDRFQYRYNQLRYHPYTWIVLLLLMVTGVLGFLLRPIMELAFILLLPLARLILGV